VTLSSRSGRLVVLVAWSVFFAWLAISGQVLRYLGPRTSWVVTFGAIALSASTLAYAYLSGRPGRMQRRLTFKEGSGLAALLAPILVAMLLANASLGALAASRKLTSRGIDLASLAISLSKNARYVSFLQLKAASDHPDDARQLDIHPGRQVTLLGFVSKPAASPSAPFVVSRFYITCCIADAIPIGVTVYPALAKGRYPRDTWLSITGAVAKRGGDFVVQAEKVEVVKEPKQPYLAFTSL
jgi:putative membrane protein